MGRIQSETTNFPDKKFTRDGNFKESTPIKEIANSPYTNPKKGDGAKRGSGK